MQTFFAMGGGMIDSSSMYRSAQQVIGTLLPNIAEKETLFAATKVWIDGEQAGKGRLPNPEQRREMISYFNSL